VSFARLRYRLHEVALVLWRRLPFTTWLRWQIVSLLSARYVVGAHAVIRDDRGQILLLYHPYRGQYPWGMPGGGLKRNESPEQGVVRETFEEIGLHVRPRRLLLVRKSKNVSHLAIVYECEIVGGEMNFGPEVREARYFAPEAIPEQMMAGERAAIREALGLLEG
jgi:ADP-ribose pyrophosphatase YjhB (NUDIX family)